MASERARAKRDIEPSSGETSEPPELQQTLSSAHALRHELAKKKEEYRHLETMKDKEIAAKAAGEDRDLGVFGRWLGASTNSPIAIASITVVTGLFAAIFCFVVAAYSQKPDSWFHEAEWGGALAATSLSFIFGRSGRK
jgi:hypothetical protein